MAIRISTPIVERLTEQGLIPKRCFNLELLVPASGAMTLRYEIYLTDEHCAALGQAFLDMASEQKAAK